MENDKYNFTKEKRERRHESQAKQQASSEVFFRLITMGHDELTLTLRNYWLGEIGRDLGLTKKLLSPQNILPGKKGLAVECFYSVNQTNQTHEDLWAVNV